MKLVKTASGKQTLKMSKKEWQSIGKKAGWMKVSQKENQELLNKIKKALDVIKNEQNVSSVTQYTPTSDQNLNSADTYAYQVIIRTIAPNCNEIYYDLSTLSESYPNLPINSVLSNSGIGQLAEIYPKTLQGLWSKGDVQKTRQLIVDIKDILPEVIVSVDQILSTITS